MPPNYRLHSGDPQHIDITTIRPLSTIERSYIQTFPASFKFFGTKTNLEQMIGNSVPVNLAFFVASTILKYIKEGNTSQEVSTLFDLMEESFNIIPDRYA